MIPFWGDMWNRYDNILHTTLHFAHYQTKYLMKTLIATLGGKRRLYTQEGVISLIGDHVAI